MKKQSLVFKEQRGDIQGKLKAILDKASDEKRNVTDEELAQVKDLSEQRDALDAKIAAAELVEREQLRLAQEEVNQRGGINVNIGNPRNKEGEEGERRNLRQAYSVRESILNHIEGRDSTGATAEVEQEGVKEIAEQRLAISAKGVYIPTMMLHNPVQKRANLTVGTAATAGRLVFEENPELVGFLYPRTVLLGMGVRYIAGLLGDFPIVRKNAAGAAAWEGETDTNAQTNPTYEKVLMQPKRLGAVEIYSIQLLRQSAFDVELEVRNDIMMAQGQGLETAAINGSGSGNQPTGLLNISSIPTVEMGADGGPLTWPKAVEFETKIATNNADLGTMGWLTTPGVVGFAKSTEKTSTNGNYIMTDNNNMNGYGVNRSTLVPSNLTKGSGSNLHAAIFGQWGSLYIGQWGGLEVVVDPYSSKKEAMYEVSVNGFYDINVKHKESFAVAKDIDIS